MVPSNHQNHHDYCTSRTLSMPPRFSKNMVPITKFNSSPLKSYRNPIGKDTPLQPPFFRGELLDFGIHLQPHSSLTSCCQVTMSRPQLSGNRPLSEAAIFSQRFIYSKMTGGGGGLISQIYDLKCQIYGFLQKMTGGGSHLKSMIYLKVYAVCTILKVYGLQKKTYMWTISYTKFGSKFQ